jgi:hypothetical protein
MQRFHSHPMSSKLLLHLEPLAQGVDPRSASIRALEIATPGTGLSVAPAFDRPAASLVPIVPERARRGPGP